MQYRQYIAKECRYFAEIDRVRVYFLFEDRQLAGCVLWYPCPHSNKIVRSGVVSLLFLAVVFCLEKKHKGRWYGEAAIRCYLVLGFVEG